MKVQVNDKAFKGMVNWNGRKATLETKKGTNEPDIGASGETMRFSIAGLGSRYLWPDQYTILDD